MKKSIWSEELRFFVECDNIDTMELIGIHDCTEKKLLQFETEDLRALLRFWYIEYLWSISVDDLEGQLTQLEGQLRNLTEPKEEFWKELKWKELTQKIETIELIETIRHKIQELVIRKKNEFFDSCFYVTSRGVFYEKLGENIRWKEILKKIPELPYKEIVSPYEWVIQEEDSRLTRNIPGEHFSGPEFSRSDI